LRQLWATKIRRSERLQSGPRNRTGVIKRPDPVPPIERTSLQLPTKTGHFKAVFQCFSRVRSTESSGFLERSIGIEPNALRRRPPVFSTRLPPHWDHFL